MDLVQLWCNLKRRPSSPIVEANAVHLNAAALLPRAVKVSALRQSVGRATRHTEASPFGNDRPSRR